MKKVSIKKIKEEAKKLAQEGKSWHFHILTPECQFNDSDKSAFILENASDGEVFVYYSDEPQMGVGKELVKLLHGKDVVKDSDKNGEDGEGELSESVKEIIKRAKALNKKGKFWHHHMLFPDCFFNEIKGKWMIVLEDHEEGELLSSVFDNEPKSALKEIEPLFYKQRK